MQNINAKARKNGKVGRPKGVSISLNDISSYALLFLLSNAIRTVLKKDNKWSGGLQPSSVSSFFEDYGINIPDTVKNAFNAKSIFLSKKEYNITLQENSLKALLFFIHTHTPDVFFDYDEDKVDEWASKRGEEIIAVAAEDEEGIYDEISVSIRQHGLEYLMTEIFSMHMNPSPDRYTREGLFKIFTALKNMCYQDSGMTSFFFHYLSTRIKNDISVFTRRGEKKSVLALPVGHNEFNNIFKHLFDYFKGFVLGTSVPEFNELIWDNEKSVGADVLIRNERFVDGKGKFLRFFIDNAKRKIDKDGGVTLSKPEKKRFLKQLKHGVTVYFIYTQKDITTSDYDFTIFVSPEICVNKMNFETDCNGTPTLIESEIRFGDAIFFQKVFNDLKQLATDNKSHLYKIEYAGENDVKATKADPATVFLEIMETMSSFRNRKS